jgi:serine/threonine-protein kinase
VRGVGNAAPDVEGSLIAGRYRLEGVLGEGGIGVVWSAVDERTGLAVALKAIKPGWGGEELNRRLYREARATTLVSHPHIVKMLDVVQGTDGAPILVMERLLGETLADRLERDGRLRLPVLADLLLPAMGAVRAAHDLGVVHRDLKPANLFLSGAGDGDGVRVLDFGLAKLLRPEGPLAESGALTASGTLLGTPLYMSPEQVLGARDVALDADVRRRVVVRDHPLRVPRRRAADRCGRRA